MSHDVFRVGVAQIAPVFLDREATLLKMLDFTRRAADDGASLVVFGEALLPGYPFWLSKTDGARFDSDVQKDIHAHYIEQSVDLSRGHLRPLQALARQKKVAISLGVVERAADRGGKSLYCSLVAIDAEGEVASLHRKLVPTYEKRLVWGAGDGHGLRVHDCGPFKVGGLNCWENWMPLSRSALQAQGEDLHVAVWPGGMHNTTDITRFMALEGRSFVVSVSGVLRPRDVPTTFPHRSLFLEGVEGVIANGGSAVAAPDGRWILEPVADDEGLFVVELNPTEVLRERQNFDPAGHYSRPDVTKLVVDRRRQGLAEFVDDSDLGCDS